MYLSNVLVADEICQHNGNIGLFVDDGDLLREGSCEISALEHCVYVTDSESAVLCQL